MALTYFCFDIGGVASSQENTGKAVSLGNEYWGEDFSKTNLKRMLFANLGDGRDYWREFQNGLLPKEKYLEKSLLAGNLPLSAENKTRLENCLKTWCGDPYLPIWEFIFSLKQQMFHTSVLTNNNEIMYNAPSGRIKYLVDVATSSHEIHVSKPEEEAYIKHLDLIGAKAEDTFCTDDKLVNVQVFQHLGGCGFHFRSKDIGMDRAFKEMLEFLQEKGISYTPT